MKRVLQEHHKKPEQTLFSFYYHMFGNYRVEEPILLEADDLEQAKEIFLKEYPNHSLYMIKYKDRVITGFGWDHSLNSLDLSYE